MIEFRFEVTETKVDLTAIWPPLKSAARSSAEDVKKMEEEIVGNWKDKPTFSVQETEADMVVTYELVPVGPSDGILKWRAVSRGAEGKTFGPKTAQALVFPYQGKGQSYIPKTTRSTWGGPGVKVGPISRFKKVDWPGIEPRQFEETVMGKYKPTFVSKINAALASARVR